MLGLLFLLHSQQNKNITFAQSGVLTHCVQNLFKVIFGITEVLNNEFKEKRLEDGVQAVLEIE